MAKAVAKCDMVVGKKDTLPETAVTREKAKGKARISRKVVILVKEIKELMDKVEHMDKEAKAVEEKRLEKVLTLMATV